MTKEELVILFDSYAKAYKWPDKQIGDCGKITEIQFEQLIEEILIKYKLANAELQAKVNAYEKIIANSNFNVILGDKENE